MNDIIKTKRLTVRKTILSDVDLLLKTDKQEETQRFLGGIKVKTRKDRLEFVKNMTNNSYTVCLKDGVGIGFISIKKDNEISYLFDYDYTKNGYCTEALKALLKHFKLNSIIAKVKENNVSSIRVLEKCNFKYKYIDSNGFLVYEYYKN